MSNVDFHDLIKKISSDNINADTAACMILYAMQEDAVEPLIEQYYYGVTDKQGVAILDVLAQIGGPSALAMLRNVFAFEEDRRLLRFAAAKGLIHNSSNLSRDELAELAQYLGGIS